MKGRIYMPEGCKHYLGDRYAILFKMIVDNIKGFKLEYRNFPEVPKNTDVVIVYGPQHSWPNVFKNLVDLDKSIKLIGYVADLWWYSNNGFKQNMTNLLNRYDVILSSCDFAFKKLWGDWIHKRKLFPNFFAPHERYCTLTMQEDPIKKILISGALGDFYPLRTHVRNNLKKDLYFNPPHPGFHKRASGANYVGDGYAKLINKYSCALGTSSKYKMAVTKYFEIMAAGTLLIANETEDSELAGLKANTHFVPITQENAIDVIEDCINHPEKYKKIRELGMIYTRNNHSVKNRYNQLKKIISDLVGEKI